MNNKGFAISAVIYSLLILFLLIFLSFIGVLGAQSKLLQKSADDVATNLVQEEMLEDGENIEIDPIDFYQTTISGRYEISFKNKKGYIYLPKNAIITNKIDKMIITINDAIYELGMIGCQNKIVCFNNIEGITANVENKIVISSIYAIYKDAKIDYNLKSNNDLSRVRWIKDCINGSTYNTGNYWVEIKAMKNENNVALNKPVIFTRKYSDSSYPIVRITDGDIATANYVAGGPGYQCVIVDLEAFYDLDSINIWHYYGDNRVYYNNKTYVSSNKSAWTEVMRNFNLSSSEGITITPTSDKVKGYVSNGLVLWYDGILNTGTTRNITTTSWKDLSGNGNNGTLYNVAATPTTTSGWGTNYLLFDGVDDYVKTTQTQTVIDLLESGSVTVEIGFSPITVDNSNALISLKWLAGTPGKGLVNSVCISNNQNKFLIDARCDLSNKIWRLHDTVLSLNAIYAGATVLDYNSETDQTSSYVYLNNNKQVMTQNINQKIVNSANNYIYLGGLYNGGTAGTPPNFFNNAKIYYVRLYDRALTEEELNRNYLLDKERYGF